MSVHQYRDGRWFAVWYEAGKQKRRVFGRGELAERQARMIDRERNGEKRKILPTSLSVAHLCQAYHNEHPVERSTHRNDAYKFGSCLLPVLGNTPSETITKKDLLKYTEARLKDGVKRTTAWREIRLLKAVFSWAEDQDPPLIPRNQIAKFRMKGIDGAENVPIPPTFEETKRILANAEPHMVRAIYLLWHCGIRPGGELLRITWSDVDFKNQEIRVISARKGGPAVRYVPFMPELKPLLSGWIDHDRRVLKQVDGLQIVHYGYRRIDSLKHAWENTKARAGITRKLRPYDLRHAFATICLRSGADLKSVSEVMGHSRPDTTVRIYQHVVKRQHREVAEKVPWLGDLGQCLDNVVPLRKPRSKARRDLRRGAQPSQG